MSNWEFDKEEIMAIKPEIDQWLGALIVTEASVVEDRDHNVDLVVRGGRIALRGRWVFSTRDGWDNFKRYWREFTIRSERRVNATELDKLEGGESRADWMFYLWVDNNTKKIRCGTVIDLPLLIPHLASLPWNYGENRDISRGSFDSKFRGYSIRHAALKGCVIDHRYADDYATSWEQRQLALLVRNERRLVLERGAEGH